MDRSELTIWNILRSVLGMLVFFVVFLIATPFIVLMLLLSFGKLTNFLMERVGPLMMKPVFAASGIRFRIKQHGQSIERPAVYLVNHSSTVDLLTIIALGLPRIRFVAKWELQYNPLFFIIGRLTGQVFIKRQDTEKAVQTLKKAYRRIKEKNLSVLLAPEGSRKHPGIIGPFKKGPFHMALDLDYPIVPIYFEGNRELSAGGSLLTKSGSVTAHIYQPIDTSEWKRSNLEAHIKTVRNRYLKWAGVQEHDVSPIA
ncbi:MAG: lysophospholipid acyltransferase family protein [Balneolaceae bacterium]|nr:lysophospholipid acyltransferase family protein [Balneolaceae bacterium]